MNIKNEVRARKIYFLALQIAKTKSPDFAKVASMLQEAAKLGSNDSNYALASWYLSGRYFTENWSKAVVYLKRACNGGNSEACFDLAVCYETGKGIEQDLNRAFELYLESALRGDISAHREVARCFWHGIGTKKNRTIAHLWGDAHKLKLKKSNNKATS